MLGKEGRKTFILELVTIVTLKGFNFKMKLCAGELVERDKVDKYIRFMSERISPWVKLFPIPNNTQFKTNILHIKISFK